MAFLVFDETTTAKRKVYVIEAESPLRRIFEALGILFHH